jgi:hypothetical protein
MGVRLREAIVEDADCARRREREARHHVGGGERRPDDEALPAESVLQKGEARRGSRPGIREQGWMGLAFAPVPREPDDDPDRRKRRAVCEVSWIIEGPPGRARAGRSRQASVCRRA